jgi:hypothetical protein
MDNYDTHELTAISFNPVVPNPPERRTEPRQTTLLRVGKLVVGGEERLCMIRNISSAGAMIKLYQPLAVDVRVEVEITPDCPVSATVIWAEEDLAGVGFDEPLDVVAALRGLKHDGPYRRVARTPRLQLRRPAKICTDTLEAQVLLCDMSLNGAKIETGEKLAHDSEIALFVEGLPPLAGRVRWCKDHHAGLEFDIPMQMDTLAGWIGADAEH